MTARAVEGIEYEIERVLQAVYMDHDDYKVTTTLLSDMARAVAAIPSLAADRAMPAKQPEVVEIRHRYTDKVLFSWEVDPEVTGLEIGEKLGRAVLAAVQARANLRGANLSGAYLSDANLSGANLRDAYLSDANLRDANLSGANLRDAYLSDANLRDAYLRDANLSDANLSGAYLSDANLSGANLRDANLRDAYLSDANLSGANLSGAYLSDANLSGANLSDAKGAELAIAKTRILPEGDLIGWKKCQAGVIVKLQIPADAKRSHAFGRKCRAEFADVLEVIGAEAGISSHDGKTEYRVGQRVVPDRFEEDWQLECAPGVHFFITMAEAEAY
jgi:uncharacterized protein YjbI with pentapeptide repeats